MATDEKRRIVYELMVEAKGLAENSKKAQDEMKRVADAATGMRTAIKGALTFAGVESFKSLLTASTAFRQVQDAARDAVSGFVDAAVEAAGFNRELQQLDGFVADFKALGSAVGSVVGLFRDGASAVSNFFATLVGDSKAAQIAMTTLERAINPARTFIDAAKAVKASREGLAGEFRQAAEDARERGEADRKLLDSMAGVERQIDGMVRGAIGDFNTLTAAALDTSDTLAAMPQALRDAIAAQAQQARVLQEFRNAAQAARATPAQPLADIFTEAEDAAAALNVELANTAALLERDVSASLQVKTTWEELTEAASDAAEVFSNDVRSASELLVAAGDVVVGAFTGLFSGATKNARDFFRTVLQGFAQLLAQQAALKAMASVFSLFGISTASAKGNLFDHGALVPMAAGGIVTGPTVFPMAGGRTGLMGEAGAEAVMPLRRSRTGRLGVEATAPQVHLHNNTGVQLTADVLTSDDRTEIVLQAAQMGAELAQASMHRSVTTGYGPTAQSFQRAYGLRRRV